MLSETNRPIGIASVASAALQVALVQQTQFEEVLEETVDRQREEKASLNGNTENSRGEAVIGALVDNEPEPVEAKAAPAEVKPGTSVNIEV